MQVFEAAYNNAKEELESLMQHRSQGIVRLIARLKDNREEVRNQALLLLTGLTERNDEIKKVVVFNEGFDEVSLLLHHKVNP